jgi:hypothetical protein
MQLFTSKLLLVFTIFFTNVLSLRLAIVGDQGIGTHPRAVLSLIRDFNPNGVLLLGDFDYKGISYSIFLYIYVISPGDVDNPRGFMDMLDDTLGPTLPLFPVVGNHDVDAWSLPEDGYAALFNERHVRSGLEAFCDGELGVNMACVWNDTVCPSRSFHIQI